MLDTGSWCSTLLLSKWMRECMKAWTQTGHRRRLLEQAMFERNQETKRRGFGKAVNITGGTIWNCHFSSVKNGWIFNLIIANIIEHLVCVLSSLCVFIHSLLILWTQLGSYSSCLHLTNEAIEAWRNTKEQSRCHTTPSQQSQESSPGCLLQSPEP